jgi:hypothetical protein
MNTPPRNRSCRRLAASLHRCSADSIEWAQADHLGKWHCVGSHSCPVHGAPPSSTSREHHDVRTLTLRATSNNIKHSNKNKNYNEVLETPFLFNLRTVSMARRRCNSCLSRPDAVSCGREVTERAKRPHLSHRRRRRNKRR